MTRVLVAIGSMGDLRPQLALARARRAEGADVLLLGLEDYAPLAADSGVPFRDVGTRLMGPVTPPLLARAARGARRSARYSCAAGSTTAPGPSPEPWRGRFTRGTTSSPASSAWPPAASWPDGAQRDRKSVV